jgi:hypothetical protein
LIPLPCGRLTHFDRKERRERERDKKRERERERDRNEKGLQEKEVE